MWRRVADAVMPNIPLQGVIADLRVHCRRAPPRAPSEPLRVHLEPAIGLTFFLSL